MTIQWRGYDLPDTADDADVLFAQALADAFKEGDPTVDGLVSDDEFPWAVVLICILCAIAAPALAWTVVQIALHWRGAGQLAVLAAIVAAVLRFSWRAW